MGNCYAIVPCLIMDLDKNTTVQPLNFDTLCPHCYFPMRPEHAHYRCHNCGERDSCCEGGQCD